MTATTMASVLGLAPRKRRYGLRASRAIFVVVALAAAGTGCGKDALPHIAVQSPVDTALSWFKSIDEHNLPLAKAHFAPADRSQMAWGSDFEGSSFSDVRCRLVAQEITTSEVYCAFDMPRRPSDMDGVTFWTIDMQREPAGPWLIASYGQG
jgi:hypothetical protein